MKIISEGIMHFENSSFQSALLFVDNIEKIKIFEKVDGANLELGLDQDGNLFVSRELKRPNAIRYYLPEEWPNIPDFQQFIYAHKAILENLDVFKKYLSKGEVIQLEIVFLGQSNLIQYSPPNKSFIVFTNFFDNNNHSELIHELNSVKLDCEKFISVDGKNISKINVQSEFQFISLKPLKFKLYKPNITKDNYKNELLKFKQFILKQYKTMPSFSNRLEKEGIVLTFDNKQLKIVDKDNFTAKNIYSQSFRKLLITPSTFNGDVGLFTQFKHEIEQFQNGIVDETKKQSLKRILNDYINKLDKLIDSFIEDNHTAEINGSSFHLSEKFKNDFLVLCALIRKSILNYDLSKDFNNAFLLEDTRRNIIDFDILRDMNSKDIIIKFLLSFYTYYLFEISGIKKYKHLVHKGTLKSKLIENDFLFWYKVLTEYNLDYIGNKLRKSVIKDLKEFKHIFLKNEVRLQFEKFIINGKIDLKIIYQLLIKIHNFLKIGINDFKNLIHVLDIDFLSTNKKHQFLNSLLLCHLQFSSRDNILNTYRNFLTDFNMKNEYEIITDLLKENADITTVAVTDVAEVPAKITNSVIKRKRNPDIMKMLFKFKKPITKE